MQLVQVRSSLRTSVKLIERNQRTLIPLITKKPLEVSELDLDKLHQLHQAKRRRVGCDRFGIRRLTGLGPAPTAPWCSFVVQVATFGAASELHQDSKLEGRYLDLAGVLA